MNWRRKLLLSVAAVAASCALAEIALRIAGSFDTAAAREAARARLAQMSGNRWGGPDSADIPNATEEDGPEFLLHPYTGYDVGSSDQWTADELAQFANRRKATYDVLVLGGSVAAGFAKDCKRQLTIGLESDPRWKGWNVRVLGHGRGGFRQPQPLHLLEYLFSIGYQPDVVLELDGFNEVALGLANARAGVHPAMPSIAHWAHLASSGPLTPRAMDAIAAVRREQNDARGIVECAESCGLFHSAIATRIVRGRIERCYGRYAEAAAEYERALAAAGDRSYCIGPKFEGDDGAVLDLCARIWADSSRDMAAICAARGIRYLHVLQPTLHDEGSKPATDDERKKGAEPAVWALGAKLGYPKLRERGEELRRNGVEFVDESRLFADVTKTLYYDVCHFAPEGNHLLAEKVLPVLLAKPPPEPPAK